MTEDRFRENAYQAQVNVTTMDKDGWKMVNLLLGLLLFINGCVLIIISGLIIQKNTKYILNQLMAVDALFFGIFFFVESINQLFVPFEFVMNLLRDISTMCAICAAIMFLFSAMYIAYGKERIFSKKLQIIYISTLIILLGAGILFDYAYALNQEVIAGPDPRWGILGYFPSYIIPLVAIISGLLIFFFVYKSTDDQEFKQRLKYIIFGITIITLSMLYFVLFDLLAIYDSVSTIIGHFGYFCGALCLYNAFR